MATAGFSSVVYISLLSSTLSCNYHKLDIIHEIKFLQYRQLSRAIITNLISFHNLKILQDPLRLCASDIHHELYRVITTNSISSTIANINRFLFGCVHRPRSFLEIGFRPQYPSFVWFEPLSRTKRVFWISTRKTNIEWAGVDTSWRVRYPPYSMKLFVRCDIHCELYQVIITNSKSFTDTNISRILFGRVHVIFVTNSIM